MTTTTGEVLAAITRAAGTSDALRAARTAMTRDGGDETAPSWAAYLAALVNYDAATAALTAARDSRWDDDDADCPDCGGYGVVTATRTGVDGDPCANCMTGPATW